MPLDKEAAKKVLAHIDREELAQLACDLVNLPSPTGQEKAVAEYILNWFHANGFKAVRQEVEVDRPNAVGILKGDGTGLSLGFNGHMDTSFTGTQEDLRMVANVEPDSDLKGSIKDGKVRGLGISNMKGGVAAFMMAGMEPRAAMPMSRHAVQSTETARVSGRVRLSPETALHSRSLAAA